MQLSADHRSTRPAHARTGAGWIMRRMLCSILVPAVLVPAILAGPGVAAAEAGGGSQTDEQKRARLEALRSMLDGEVCANRAAAEALLAVGSGPSGATPMRTGAIPDAAEPSVGPSQPPEAGSDKNQSPVPSGDSAKPLSRAEMVATLRDAVVLVIAGTDTGSGFFIGPNRVLTNHHVIANATSGKVVVVGPSVSGPRQARVIATTGEDGANSRDYALLDVAGPPAPVTLTLSPRAGELDNVIAAGFPGLLLANDMNFSALVGGDMSAMPNLALSQGTIMARQNAGRGVVTLAHTAAISGGNSGGPLVDACGRVVGVNTFINVSVDQASSAGFALSAEDLIAFLEEEKIPFSQDRSLCSTP